MKEQIKAILKIVRIVLGSGLVVLGIMVAAGGGFFPVPGMFVAFGGLLIFGVGSQRSIGKAKTSDPMICPRCGRGYDNSWQICLYDSAELEKNVPN
jgi:hypothetical protein